MSMVQKLATNQADFFAKSSFHGKRGRKEVWMSTDDIRQDWFDEIPYFSAKGKCCKFLKLNKLRLCSERSIYRIDYQTNQIYFHNAFDGTTFANYVLKLADNSNKDVCITETLELLPIKAARKKEEPESI
jgi:hypothetical protein